MDAFDTLPLAACEAGLDRSPPVNRVLGDVCVDEPPNAESAGLAAQVYQYKL